MREPEMAGKYEKAISISEAITSIEKSKYLLPSIQRKFVWNSSQICVLFDSVMQGYPINSFMMWEISDNKIKEDYKFYEFLKEYCQRFKEDNPPVKTHGSYHDFKAVIDGQQRLTSLYIGLCGTYAYKQPRVWWPSTYDEKCLPPRKLYLDLRQHLSAEDDDSRMKYNFHFLTKEQLDDSQKSGSDGGHHWFCVSDVLNFPRFDSPTDVLRKVVIPELQRRGLDGIEFPEETLSKLYEVIRTRELIHYFKETSQDIDHVLDVFIRTNSGGTQLAFSDLLISIAIAHWDGDFRKELDDLTKQIYGSSEMGFYLERDWVLKTSLMLINADVSFKVKNFTKEQVKRIQAEWSKIKECIKETLRLIRWRFGINPQSLISKNAVIPVCYYLYKQCQDEKPLFCTINDLAKNHENRDRISRWFYMALLKGVFGGQADTMLRGMREILGKNLNQPLFPLEKIIERYKATNKDLRFDEEYIDKLLSIQHGEGRCRALLHLLFPEMNVTEVFHIDHLHPKSHFYEEKLKKIERLANDEKRLDYYIDPLHWNTIPNLHLLNNSQNLVKSDRSLRDWIDDPNVHLSEESLLVPGADLSFEAFPEFFEERRKALKLRLMDRVTMSERLPLEPSQDDTDEEVVDDITA